MSDIVRYEAPDLSEVATLAKALMDSGFFPDVDEVAKAGVKILAGREFGLGPVESMKAFHVLTGQGRATLEFSATFLARRVKQHPRYDYRVLELSNEACEIAFFQDGEEIGRSRFDEGDREAMGLDLETTRGNPTSWAKVPRNMMFSRAMTNGVRWYVPDVAAGSALLAYADAPAEAATSVHVVEPEGNGDDHSPAVDSGVEVPPAEPSMPVGADREDASTGTAGDLTSGGETKAAPAARPADPPEVSPSELAYGEGAGSEGTGEEPAGATTAPVELHTHVYKRSEKTASLLICTFPGCNLVRSKGEVERERQDA